MTEKEREFLKKMKILLINFEYENDTETKLDTIDEMGYAVRDFQKEYGDN